MSTIQIVGIAAATVVVLLLILALVVTRKSGGDKTEDVTENGAGTSFLDSSPSDTFAKLGRAEVVAPPPSPAEAPATVPPGPAVVMNATGVAASTDGGLGLDWDQPEPPSPRDVPPAAAPVPAPADEMRAGADKPRPAARMPDPDEDESGPDESEATGELPVITAVTDVGEREVEPTAEEEPQAEAADESGAHAEAAPRSEATTESAGGPEPADDLVPLSSIIVTTSTKMVDLRDPDVRRMLTELVTFEIDQATQFRKNGQSIDAVLQLTEAEKICRALGKHDTAREIRDMMRELKD